MALPNIDTIGNLCADPEVRTTNSGTSVTNFRIASTEKGKDGRPDQTTFLSVVAWKNLGENVASKFRKGDRIAIKGKLGQREYEKDGQKHTVFEVKAWEVFEPVSSFADDGGRGGQKSGGFGASPAVDPFNESTPF